MTVRAPVRARSARRAVGEVGERVGAEQDQRVDLAVGRGPQDAVGVEAARVGQRRPHVGEPVAAPASSATRPGSRPGAMPMSSAPRTLPRRSAGRKRAPGTARRHGGSGVDDAGADSATVGRPTTTVTSAPADASERTGSRSASTRRRRTSRREQRRRRRRRPRPGGSAPTRRRTASGRCRPALSSTSCTPSSIDGVLAAGGTGPAAPPSGRDRGRARCRRARQASSMVALGQAEHELGRQAVAELGVDVVGADDALGQLRPGVRPTRW